MFIPDALGTSLLLGVLALAEGMRRLPVGTIVLRRLMYGSWSVVSGMELGAGIRLVSWLLPIDLPLILTPDHDATQNLTGQRAVALLQKRSRRVRYDLAIARLLATLILVVVVVGIPLATTTWGSYGFKTIVAFVALLTIYQGALTSLALVRIGAPRRAAMFAGVRLLWPFSALRAAEMLQAQVASGISRATIVAALVDGERLFPAWRSRIYDGVTQRSVDAEVDVLSQAYGKEELLMLLRTPPHDVKNDLFCERCGSVFRDGVTCEACSTELLRADA